jgi:hypothetical protein
MAEKPEDAVDHTEQRDEAPQTQRISELGTCDGNFSPRSHIAYLRAIQSR